MSAAQQFAVIPFHEHNLLTLSEGSTVYVAMRSVCESMGLDWKAQYNRIQRDEVLSSTVVMTTMVAADGKTREVVTLPLDMLNGWLFGIDASRVKPELKEMVLRYQRECYRVLADYWQGKGTQGSNTNQRIAQSRHRLALAKELHRTRDAGLRQVIHQQLDEVSRAMGLPTPELESLGRAAPAAPDVLKSFWEALAFLDGKGVDYNHATASNVLAINLRELAGQLLEHGQPLRFDSALRQALWQSHSPRCLHKNHTVHSRLTGKSIKCWVFERPSE